MLDTILRYGNDEPQLREELSALARCIVAAGRKDRRLVAEVEHAVAIDPHAAFRFDSDEAATLEIAGERWSAGRFETPSMSTLRARCAAPSERARIHLYVLTGASPLTDIGALQANSGNDVLFQVASQFNCLESPGSYVTPVASYFGDPTQGPRASISAFPATLLRHYLAPADDGSRFVQRTGGSQIDLLAKACGRPVCRNGYFTGERLDATELARSLEENFERIEAGVHDRADVVYGANWDGRVDGAPRIAQVFTSTVAGGGYGGERHLGVHFGSISRLLLRAAYLGTLLASVALGKRRVVLTLIGGGVFANPPAMIWDAILWAIDEVAPFLSQDVDLFVNGHQTLKSQSVIADVRARGGVLLGFDASGLGEVLR